MNSELDINNKVLERGRRGLFEPYSPQAVGEINHLLGEENAAGYNFDTFVKPTLSN